jgi:drug/metabolite transporter (DMT)-like permease
MQRTDVDMGAPSGSAASSLVGSSRLRLHGALVLVQLAFGSLAVEGKLLMSPGHGVSPAALVMARIFGAALVFGVAHVVMRTPRVRSWLDVARLAGLALAGVVINQLLFMSGLRLTSPVAATLLIATIPLFAALVAAIFRRDRITGRAALGIGVAVLGIAVLSRFALPHAGDVLVLANSLSYAFFVVFAKDMIDRFGAVTVTAWVFGLGALIFAPLGALQLAAEVPSWSRGTVALTAYVVLVPTVLAYGINAWALRRATPTLVAVYVYLQPIVVVALAWLQLGEPLHLHAIVGGLLILAGVAVAASARRLPGHRFHSAGAESPSGTWTK